MDTSRKYYEDTILDFNRRRRGRSLCQFCKDEGIDYQWLLKAKRKYSDRTREEETSKHDDSSENPEDIEIIKVHYVDDTASASNDRATDQKQEWRVGSLMLIDPDGNSIAIGGGSAQVLGKLLTKLAACHD